MYLSEVPRPHGVVEAARPQLGAVRGDVNAARAVRVPLELPAGLKTDSVKFAVDYKQICTSNVTTKCA